MRLGQLARKLALRPAEIVNFLAAKNIRIEEGSNTRLEDGHVVMIMEQYAPTRLDEILVEPDEAEEQRTPIVPEPAMEAVATESVEKLPEVAETESLPEVIKVQKVELPGLKVLGKIEFPEPKKKIVAAEETAAPETTSAPQEPTQRTEVRRNSPRKPDRREQRPGKNPIAVKREQEAMEAERRRREELERKKELKKQHYHKKVKPVAPTRAARLVDDPVEVATQEMEEAPKSLVGRFMKWLRN
jgi:hypothetical protein